MDDLLDGKIESVGPDMTPAALKVVDHFMKDLEEAAKDYTVPNEAWCAELYDVRSQLKKLKEREEKLLEVAKKYKDLGTTIHGNYTLKKTERAGSRTLDKDALLSRIEAELGADEAKVYVEACTKQGKPSVVISIEKINQGVSGPGESGL